MLLKGGKPANKSPANVQVSFKGNSNAISDDVVLSFWRTFADHNTDTDSNHDQHQHHHHDHHDQHHHDHDHQHHDQGVFTLTVTVMLNSVPQSSLSGSE